MKFVNVCTWKFTFYTMGEIHGFEMFSLQIEKTEKLQVSFKLKLLPDNYLCTTTTGHTTYAVFKNEVKVSFYDNPNVQLIREQ